MAFDLLITIPEKSPAGRAVQRVIASENLTPEQDRRQILDQTDGHSHYVGGRISDRDEENLGVLKRS
jgi:hypothetical protein